MSSIISLEELSSEQLESLVVQALKIKREPSRFSHSLERKGLLLLMQKTSTRTALAFASGIAQMGGYSIRLNWNESQFPISTMPLEARAVSAPVDAIIARLMYYSDVKALAEHAEVPVINGCCDRFHPSQVVADLVTILEVTGRLAGNRVAYVGVHNNVTNSLILGCMKLGIHLALLTPIVHEAAKNQPLVREAEQAGLLTQCSSLEEAIEGADFVYTDAWVDMEHFESPQYQDEKNRRMEAMLPFQLNAKSLAESDAKIMHDMPIHLGYELTEDLVDDPRSVIFRQNENRLHAAKSMLLSLLNDES